MSQKKADAEYSKKLKDDFVAQIDSLTDLNEQQRTYLKRRWLDQVTWMSGRSSSARDSYYRIKRLTILSGVLIPVLIGTNFGAIVDNTLGTNWAASIDGVFKIIAIILGLLIASASGLNEFFKYDDRYQNYRTSVEILKAEWWYFYSLTGRYEGDTHAKAFAEFAERVEGTLRQDLKTYISIIAKDKKKDEGSKAND